MSFVCAVDMGSATLVSMVRIEYTELIASELSVVLISLSKSIASLSEAPPKYGDCSGSFTYAKKENN